MLVITVNWVQDRNVRWLSACLLAMGFLFCAEAADATSVRRLSLAEVTRLSDRVVHGVVVDVRSGRDAEGLPATWISIDVIEALKGAADETITLKQYGMGSLGGGGLIARVVGLPRYAAGEEVVLFLRADSRLGFSSPVGLEQGVYKVSGSGARRRVGSAGYAGPPVALEKFLAVVAALVASGS